MQRKLWILPSIIQAIFFFFRTPFFEMVMAEELPVWSARKQNAQECKIPILHGEMKLSVKKNEDWAAGPIERTSCPGADEKNQWGHMQPTGCHVTLFCRVTKLIFERQRHTEISLYGKVFICFVQFTVAELQCKWQFFLHCKMIPSVRVLKRGGQDINEDVVPWKEAIEKQCLWNPYPWTTIAFCMRIVYPVECLSSWTRLFCLFIWPVTKF
jgi:hypothetical protein